METSNRKTSLLGAIQAEHARFETLLRSLSAEEITRPGVVDAWSLKDILAHLTWWEQQALGVLRGVPDIYQPEIEPWETTVQRVNTQTAAASQPRPLAEILNEWRASYQQVLQMVNRLSEAELANPEVYDDLVGNTFEHAQEHRQAIQTALHLPEPTGESTG